MKGYRVYYDKSDKQWKYEDFLSEVGHTTDFENWNNTLLSAINACIRYNRNFVEDSKDMTSNNQYTICTCKGCKEDYILTYNEYFWFLDKELIIPKICPKCRGSK